MSDQNNHGSKQSESEQKSGTTKTETIKQNSQHNNHKDC